MFFAGRVSEVPRVPPFWFVTFLNVLQFGQGMHSCVLQIWQPGSQLWEVTSLVPGGWIWMEDT